MKDLRQTRFAPLKEKDRNREYETPPPITQKPLVERSPIDKKYTKEDLINRIKEGQYLWDMRCWDERSREEATAWVERLKADRHDHKNCGHVAYCIRQLLYRGVDAEKIVDAIMENNNIKYKNRLVRCWLGGPMDEDFKNHPCHKIREAGGYGPGLCEECE